MSKIETNKALVKRLLDEIWGREDFSHVEEFIAFPYTLFNDPNDPWDGQSLDRDGFVERVRKSRAPFPDQKFTVVHWVTDETQVAIAWTWDATHKGDIPGFPATGKTLAMSGMTVYPVIDGKITGHWQVADRLTIGQQLMANKA